MMQSDEELMRIVLEVFCEEQVEHRQAISELIFELERDPGHPQAAQLIDQLFREAHSLKGGACAANLEDVEHIAHELEDLVTLVRIGQLRLTQDVSDTIHGALEAIGAIMVQVAAGQPRDPRVHQPLLRQIKALITPADQDISDLVLGPTAVAEHEVLAPTPEVLPPGSVPAANAGPGDHMDGASVEQDVLATAPELFPPGSVPVANAGPGEHMAGAGGAADGAARGTAGTTHLVASNGRPHAGDGHGADRQATDLRGRLAGSTVRLPTNVLDQLLSETGELMTCTVRAQQAARHAQALAGLPSRWRMTWRQVSPALAQLQAQAPVFQPTVHYLDDRSDLEVKSALALGRGHDAQTSLLVDALQQANALIGELERRLSGYARQTTEDHTRLAAVTDRLHTQMRRTRMLPLSTLFSPLRIQVRDIARAAGKRVTLQLDDGGAQADRQVLEGLREVLLHLLRNALDHGIELPADRERSGKPAEGHIELRAAVRGDSLALTLHDDGAGLDAARIRQRAMRSGLLSENDAARLGERELFDLIFMSGFTTRQTITALSGRGMGLDIVRAQVERMHGRVTVESTAGCGTTFTLQVPLSLTSSHGLLLRVGSADEQETYVIALEAVQRIVAVDAAHVHIIEGRPAIKVDGRPTPLVGLADILHVAAARDTTGAQAGLALLLGIGDRQIACLVDDVLGEQEFVVQRLPAPMQQLRCIAGATILADGAIVPILDVVDLLRGSATARPLTPALDRIAHMPEERKLRILVVDDSITTRTLEKNILEAAGYEVRLATDGHEALQLLEQLMSQDGCDLLLSDVDMPRLNGFELTAQVRAHSTLRHTPIVLVTSLDSPTDRERGIAAGADAYIIKRAFDQETLLQTIADLI